MVRNEDAFSHHGREIVCVDITDNPNQKFNVALFDYPCCLDVEEEGNLEAPVKQILRDNKEKFEALACKVGRMHTRAALDARSGVTFAVAPGNCYFWFPPFN